MLRREKIHDAARGKFDGRRDGELYPPLRSSFAVVPIGGASNARLHPRLKSRPSCASRTNEAGRTRRIRSVRTRPEKCRDDEKVDKRGRGDIFAE